MVSDQFRKRLAKGKFDLIAGDILTQFSEKGLAINEGIAVDAALECIYCFKNKIGSQQ